MQIPKKVKVGGLMYSVTLKDEVASGEASGQMDTAKLEIEIDKKMKRGAQEITFLHEILHAINNEMKETDIEYLAQSLYQVIIDNPSIFRGGAK